MIRRINPSDKDIFLRFSREFYSSDAVLKPVGDANHEAMFAQLMESDVYAECFMLESEGQTVGYAQISKTYSHEAGGIVVWLEEFYVQEQYRGRGLGSEFLSFMLENIPARRYRLETEPENIRAAELYKRNGFVPFPYVQFVFEKSD